MAAGSVESSPRQASLGSTGSGGGGGGSGGGGGHDRAVAILTRLAAGPPRKTLSASELSAVQHAMPKTYVSRTLLHENPGEERHLTMTVDRLRRRQVQYESNHISSTKKFIDSQQRKHKSWKVQDEMRTSSMNFPTLRSIGGTGTGEQTPQAGDVLYRSPQYLDDVEEAVEPPDGSSRILPYMQIQRERTEFIKLPDGKTFVQRLPTVIVNDDLKMTRYNTYCGKQMLKMGAPSLDTRFRHLTGMLTPSPERKVVQKQETSPTKEVSDDSHEHLVTKSVSASCREPTKQVEVARQESISAGNHERVSEERHESLVDALKKVNPKHDVRRSRVVFPSLHRSKTLPEGFAQPTKDKKTRTSLSRERTNESLRSSKSRRQSIKRDLRENGIDGLRHRYGKLKGSYKDCSIAEESDEDSEAEHNGYCSPSLKRRFNVHSAVKSVADEE